MARNGVPKVFGFHPEWLHTGLVASPSSCKREIVTILATTRGICEKVNVEVLYQDSGQDGGVDRATLLTTHDHIKITEPSRNT